MGAYLSMQNKDLNELMDWASDIFSFLFALEMFVKWVALGLPQYFAERWNRFDCFIVCLAAVSFASRVLHPIPLVVRVFRALRSLRILRLLKQTRSVTRLLETLMYAATPILNVLLVTLLMVYVYALFGMALFADMPQASPHANFRTISVAMQTLFVALTGDGWTELMHECMDYRPLAFIYFVWFYLSAVVLMQQLLLGIIVDIFSSVVRLEHCTVTPAHITAFAEKWGYYDPLCTHFIQECELPVFLARVPPPFGYRGKAVAKSTEAMQKIASRIEVPCLHGRIHFVELFAALLQDALGIRCTEMVASTTLHNLARLIAEKYPTIQQDEVSYRLLQWRAMNLIQRRVRAWLAARHLRKLREEQAAKAAAAVSTPGLGVLSAAVGVPMGVCCGSGLSGEDMQVDSPRPQRFSLDPHSNFNAQPAAGPRAM